MKMAARQKAVPSRLRRWRIAAPLLLLALGSALYTRIAHHQSEQALQNASLEQLEAAAKSDPYNPRLFYLLGTRYRKNGRMNEASEAFRAAALRDAGNEAYFLAWAESAQARGAEAEAFGILTTLLKQRPGSARAHLALSQLLQKRGAYRPAYEEALAAARLSPKDSAVWRLAGTAALDGNMLVEAETAERKAIALDPGDFRAHMGLGNTLFELSRFPEAAVSLREAIRLAPDEVIAHLSLARAMLSQAKFPQDFEAVRQTLRHCAALRPDIPFVHLFLGRSYARQARWREALPPLERAARLDSKNPEVQFELARVYRRLGEEAKAGAAERRQKELIAASQDVRRESAYRLTR